MILTTNYTRCFPQLSERLLLLLWQTDDVMYHRYKTEHTISIVGCGPAQFVEVRDISAHLTGILVRNSLTIRVSKANLTL